MAFLSAVSSACGTHQECLERVHPIEKGGEEAVTRAGQLIEQALGSHAAELTWQDGTRTDVTLELAMAQVKWVESQRHPDNHTDIGAICPDRIRVLTQGALRTSDGRLDEAFEAIALDEREPSLLSTRLRRRAGALRGTYTRQSQGGSLAALSFEIQLGHELFRGGVYEEIKSGDSVAETAALGRWGDTPAATR